MAHILIAGGTGFIGRRLSVLLVSKGHAVSLLSRKKGGKSTFLWDPSRKQIDQAALEGVDAVVNLAGASLADGRWTDRYKKLIVNIAVTCSLKPSDKIPGS